jgi:uncharacterized protein (DUF1015 family)
MLDIRPFHGVLYNPQKIKDIAKVVSEPYDVISPSEQSAYHNIHPRNIIRLILGESFPADNSRDNRYTRANKFFTDWLKDKVLLADKKESIYIYSQRFQYQGRTRTRTGFIALLRLEDFAKNRILPHENTHAHAVRDRLRLLQTTGANLSPIFALFSDPSKRINALLNQYKKRHRPVIAFKKEGIKHKLWSMSDKDKIAVIQRLIKKGRVFIADGHHRYEAALNYKYWIQKKKAHPQRNSSFNYVMTYLAATDDPGLTILPTHRAVTIKGAFKLQEIMRNLKQDFLVYQFSTSKGLFSYMRRQRGPHIFGVYFGKQRFYGLQLKQRGKDSDVVILHKAIIQGILNAPSLTANIYYSRDAREVIRLVDEARFQVGFFLKPATVKQVKTTAAQGVKMPHKSTYFYPKLLSGLVINKL